MTITTGFTFDSATGEPVQPTKVIPNSDEVKNLRAQRDDANERANRLAEFLRHKGLQGEYYKWLEQAFPSSPHSGLPEGGSRFPEGESEDRICQEEDGCPTEGAVLKRAWREQRAEIERLRKALEGIARCAMHRPPRLNIRVQEMVAEALAGDKT